MEKGKSYKNVIAGLLFLLSFIVYLITLYPSIGPRDSSEFSLASYILGVAHPSGYPLFVMIGKLFTYIPIGEVAFRTNIVTALFSALTVLFVFLIGYRITRNMIGSVIGSLTLTFSYLFWVYSVHFEVFTLNSLLTLLMFYVLFLWKDSEGIRKNRYFYLFSFILGLSLCHHHILLLVVPAYIYFILSNDLKIINDIKLLLTSFGIFLIGFLPFLYLPIRAAKDPFLNWGDPSTFKGFIDAVTRAEFGRGRLSVPYLPAFSFFNLLQHIWIYIKLTVEQFTVFGVVIGSLSFVPIFKPDKRKTGITLLIAFIMTGLFFAILIGQAVIDHNLKGLAERFFINSFVIFSILIGVGCSVIISYFNHKVIKNVIIGILFILPILLVVSNFNDCDMSDNYILHDLPLNVLSSLPKDSVFYVVNDSTRFGIWYMQGVHGIRTDVITVWPYQPKWGRVQLERRYPGIPVLPHETTPAHLQNRKYYCDLPGGPFRDLYNNLTPEGLNYRAHIKPIKSLNSALLGKRNLLSNYKYRGLYNTNAHRDLFTREVIAWYAEAHDNVGIVLQNNGLLEEAIEMYKRSIAMNPDNFVPYFNLAIIYRHKGKYMDAMKMFKKSIDKDPQFLPAYKQLAVLYANNFNDIRNAVKYFEMYLSFNPDDKEITAIKDYILRNKGNIR